ncbi:MAG: hypothetical protein EBU82_10990 [Flavobacteriia bacterium]|nr:hypothetical protein [Flavobacteriia bacterium]
MTEERLFSNIFGISLYHKHQRRDRLQKELQRVGFPDISWISAMDGSQQEIQHLVERLDIVEKEYLPFFTNGHLGCLFSHYSLWLQLYTQHLNEKKKDTWYLILEDDTTFLPSVTYDMITRIWKEKPSDAGFIKFHTTYAYQPNPNLISQDYSTFYRKQTKISFSLMCYAVHTSFLPKLLFTKWKNHIDLFHSDGIYIIKTPPECQHDPQTLYSSSGLFTEGICCTNHETDSDTIVKGSSSSHTIHYSVQQLFDSVPPKEGIYSIPIYDDFKESGTCHVHFQYELKKRNEYSLG